MLQLFLLGLQDSQSNRYILQHFELEKKCTIEVHKHLYATNVFFWL